MSLEIENLEFGEFVLDLKEKLLLRHGVRLPINPKTFQLLVTLLENPKHLIEKEQLMRTLWPDSFVEEANLAFTVSLLRKALGDSPQDPRYIETVPRRGYRFIGQIGPKTDNPVESVLQPELEPGGWLHRRRVLVAVPLIVAIAIFGASFVWLTRIAAPGPSARNITPISRTSDGKITNAVVTPDGRQIVFSRKEGIGESLWRKEVGPDEQTQLIPAREVEYTGLSVTPDNEFAYFSVFSANEAVATLSRVPLAGGQAEPLSDVPTDVSVTFSPDGTKIAFTENTTSLNETYLKTANADGSNQRTLLTTKGTARDLPIFRASPAAWSPDGKTIAVSIRESGEEGSYYRILLVNAESGAESNVGDTRWNEVTNIAWLDDRELVLIDSEPATFNKNIWKVSTATGKATKLTGERAEFEWLSVSGGRIFAVQKRTHCGLYVAELAGPDRKLRSKQIYAESGLINAIAWNKDGQILLNSGESGKNEIWRMNPDGTSPQQITFDSGLRGSFDVSRVDGSVVFPANKDRRLMLFSTDASGKNPRQLTDGVNDGNPSVSADGGSVVFERGTMKPTLWTVGLEADSLAVGVTGYYAVHPAYSPDGRLISFHFIDYGGKDAHWKLGLIDSATRRLVNKLDFPVPITNRETAWNPQTGLLTMTFQDEDGSGILLIDPENGEHYTITGVGSGAITSFAWSPDGHSLAFVLKHETADVVEIGNSPDPTDLKDAGV